MTALCNNKPEVFAIRPKTKPEHYIILYKGFEIADGKTEKPPGRPMTVDYLTEQGLNKAQKLSRESLQFKRAVAATDTAIHDEFDKHAASGIFHNISYVVCEYGWVLSHKGLRFSGDVGHLIYPAQPINKGVLTTLTRRAAEDASQAIRQLVGIDSPATDAEIKQLAELTDRWKRTFDEEVPKVYHKADTCESHEARTVLGVGSSAGERANELLVLLCLAKGAGCPGSAADQRLRSMPREAVSRLAKAGLITTGSFDAWDLRITEKGRFYIDHILGIPFPEENKIYHIPQTTKAES